MAERDGVLGWMLDGCRQWQQHGLAPPAGVVSAAQEYFFEEDIVGLWIEECCDKSLELRATAKDLYGRWTTWANSNGHEAGNQKALGAALRERGFQSGKVHGQRGWFGLRPKSVAGREGKAR